MERQKTQPRGIELKFKKIEDICLSKNCDIICNRQQLEPIIRTKVKL